MIYNKLSYELTICYFPYMIIGENLKKCTPIFCRLNFYIVSFHELKVINLTKEFKLSWLQTINSNQLFIASIPKTIRNDQLIVSKNTPRLRQHDLELMLSSQLLTTHCIRIGLLNQFHELEHVETLFFVSANCKGQLGFAP